MSQFGFPDSSMDTLDETTKKIFAGEFYLRIKHLFHAHRHHSDKEDDVISAVIPKTKDDKIIKDAAYLDILNNLKRSIIIRRAEDCPDREFLSDLRGICSYAKTYIAILKSEEKLSEKESERELAFFINIQESITTKLDSKNSYFNNIENETSIKFYPYKRLIVYLVPILLILTSLQKMFSINYINSSKSAIEFISEPLLDMVIREVHLNNIFPVYIFFLGLIIFVCDIYTGIVHKKEGLLAHALKFPFFLLGKTISHLSVPTTRVSGKDNKLRILLFNIKEFPIRHSRYADAFPKKTTIQAVNYLQKEPIKSTLIILLAAASGTATLDYLLFDFIHIEEQFSFSICIADLVIWATEKLIDLQRLLPT